jgi:hypothetical protein
MATTAPTPEEDIGAPMCGCFEVCFPKQGVEEEVVSKEADGAGAAQDDSTESSAGPSEEEEEEAAAASKASKKRNKKTHRVRHWLASRKSEKKSKSKEDKTS